MRRWWLGAAAAVVATACGSEGALPPLEEGPLRIELATGPAGDFESMKDGDPLLLHAGCQGGQHIFVSIRAWGLADPAQSRLRLSLVRKADEVVVSSPFDVRIPFRRSLDFGGHERKGITLVIDDPREVVGTEVRLEASLESRDGQRASVMREGVVEWGPSAC